MRVKLFIFLAILFGGTISCVIILRYFEVNRSIYGATKEIAAFVKKLDEEKRQAILEYIAIAITEREDQINALFRRINDFKKMRERFLPSKYNYKTNDWRSSTVLMMTNQWLDLIQTTDRGKLTSSIVARPTYLEPFVAIPYKDYILVVIRANGKGEIFPYIAVPFWTSAFVKEGDQIQYKKLESDFIRDDYIFFSVKEFLTMDASLLKLKPFTWFLDPLDPSIDIESIKEYTEVIESVIQSIQVVQAKIKEEPDLIRILTTKRLFDAWVREKLPSSPDTILQGENQCKSYICEQIQSGNRAIHEGWNSRYQQNSFIWKLGELTASGMWNYNPLSTMAPRGICAFSRKQLNEQLSYCTGRGILVEEIFRKEPLSVVYNCSQEREGVCISNTMDVIAVPERGGVFLTNTMLYTENGQQGTITLGVGLNKELQKLALMVPGDILFITTSGHQVFFRANGDVQINSNWKGIDFTPYIDETSGVIKDVAGREFLFVRIAQMIDGKGHIFVIELRQNVFTMLSKLQEQTKLLMHKLFLENGVLGTIAVIIGLIVLNQILKKGIAPLTALATTTKFVALGQWDKVRISENWKKRKDEVGTLCVAFDQMVDEMKEGMKVRDLLNKVVSKDIADKILREGIKLGGEIREVTVLFADIRHFTHITEDMNPADVLEMLNSCLTVLSRVVDDHEGVIDKYIGDEIMAIFGAPVVTQNPAYQAVMCAKTMIEVLSEWNEMRKARGLCTLTIGISIHTGSVIAGNMGSVNHLNYTVIGHTANLAARMVDHAAEMEILITEETLSAPHVQENTPVEPLAPVTFKGISKPVSLYKVLLS